MSPQGYFWNFCEVHGRPVDDGRRLIFADGWVWESNRSYLSREIEPPKGEQELRQLRYVYWSIRVQQLRQERDKFIENVRVLHETQQGRSAPIALKSFAPNVQGYMRPTSRTIDWLIVEKDVENANRAVIEAELELAKLVKERELLN
jgi:hypothetical protein